MQKEIKKIIVTNLYNLEHYNNIKEPAKQTSDWAMLIIDYYYKVKNSAKGVVLKNRYFEKKPYWYCKKELHKIKVYAEKDNFYKIINEVLSDIAFRAIYKGLINPYEYEL